MLLSKESFADKGEFSGRDILLSNLKIIYLNVLYFQMFLVIKYLDNLGISLADLPFLLLKEGRLSELIPEVILMPLSTDGRLINF